MSLIPYNSRDAYSIVLRNPQHNALVLLNPQSGEVCLRKNELNIDRQNIPKLKCPRCGFNFDMNLNESAIDDQNDDININDLENDDTVIYSTDEDWRFTTNNGSVRRRLTDSEYNDDNTISRNRNNESDNNNSNNNNNSNLNLQTSLNSSSNTNTNSNSNSNSSLDYYIDRNYFRLIDSALKPHDTSLPSISSSSPPPPSPPQKKGISSDAFSQGYFQRFFRIIKELGRGGRGVVFLVEHVLDDFPLGKYACKRIPVGDDHKWLEKVLNEVHLLQFVHPNLVSYNHVWIEEVVITKFGPPVPCVYILEQYCNGGTLDDYVLNNNNLDEIHSKINTTISKSSRLKAKLRNETPTPRRLSVDEILSYFYDICLGLNYLHRNKIIHRDLKPSNCLMKYVSDSKLARVLVSDFGESQMEGIRRTATGATGTIEYAAPETLKVDPTLGCLYEFSVKTDVFSLGMILHFLCFESLPYRNNPDSEFNSLKEEIMFYNGLSSTLQLRSDLPGFLLDLLMSCTSVDPENRPNTQQILNVLESQLSYYNVPSSLKINSSTPNISFSELKSTKEQIFLNNKGNIKGKLTIERGDLNNNKNYNKTINGRETNYFIKAKNFILHSFEVKFFIFILQLIPLLYICHPYSVNYYYSFLFILICSHGFLMSKLKWYLFSATLYLSVLFYGFHHQALCSIEKNIAV